MGRLGQLSPLPQASNPVSQKLDSLINHLEDHGCHIIYTDGSSEKVARVGLVVTAFFVTAFMPSERISPLPLRVGVNSHIVVVP